jgi:hypothetical protein
MDKAICMSIFSEIPEILDELKAGRMIVLVEMRTVKMKAIWSAPPN